MLSLDQWQMKDKIEQYNEYEIVCQELREAKDVIDDLNDEIGWMQEEIDRLREEIKGYEKGEDSFTKDQRKADRAGLL